MAAALDLARATDGRFVASIDGLEVCRVSIATGDRVWELYSTVTAPGFEGRGIAGQLVRFVLAQAEAAGVRVVPSCWYVDGLMTRESPRWDHLRVAAPTVTTEPGTACRIAPAVVTEAQSG
jgi:predicted GNAT family acetyltransferase